MKEEPVSIPKDLDLPDSLNYAKLRQEGIDISQEVSGDIWTDYNDHDPGVTILEQVCFTLTELGYKTHFDVKDIIFADSSEDFNLEDNALYPGFNIFPASPLSVFDYRKILIDHLYPHVENAWIIPLEKSFHGVNMHGLFDVMLLLRESDETDKDEIRKKAFDLLNQFRNLCEDIDRIEILKPLEISIQADVSVNPNSLCETVMADMLLALGQSITPKVGFYPLDDLLDEGQSMEEIFNGPRPVHGFIRNSELETSGIHILRNLPKSSGLTEAVREVNGVEGVKNFDFGLYLADGEIPEGYVVSKYRSRQGTQYKLALADEKLPVGYNLLKEGEAFPDGFYSLEEGSRIPHGYYPILDLKAMLGKSLASFFVDGLEYEVDMEVVEDNYGSNIASNVQQFQHPIKFKKDLPKSDISLKDVEEYWSMQNLFPVNYGIGELGLPSKTSLERKAYARQLKAYLIFFEQVMANFLSQLTWFHKLFNIKEEDAPTYFTQAAKIPQPEKVFGRDHDHEEFDQDLKRIQGKFDPVFARRNRFADHLLARFGEEFLSEAYNTLNRKATAQDQKNFSQRLVGAKSLFLRNMIELSKDRGRGFNYLQGDVVDQDGALSENVSILKKRISLLFNIHDYGHRSLSQAVKEDQNIQMNGSKAKPEEGTKAFSFNFAGKDALQQLLLQGLSQDHFSVRKVGAGYAVYFNEAEADAEVVGDTGDRSGEQLVYTGESFEECEEAVLKLIRKLEELNARSEGFHLIEHLLLRPVKPSGYYVYFAKGTRKMLRSTDLSDKPDEEKFLKDIMEYGTAAGNYDIIGQRGEGYKIVLQNANGEVVALKDGFITKKSAEKDRSEIIEFLKTTKERQLKRSLKLEEYIPQGAMISDDFYSQKLSVVLPLWPARFQNEKVRLLFEQIIRMNAPAHLNIVCHWVNLGQMADFEKVYDAWLKEKSNASPDFEKLDELSFAMMLLIKLYINPTDPVVEKELPSIARKLSLAVKLGNG